LTTNELYNKKQNKPKKRKNNRKYRKNKKHKIKLKPISWAGYLKGNGDIGEKRKNG